MKTVGIVCEFNPFHEGHRYLIQKVRESIGGDSRVICLMSGDFVQRGEPAVYDKYERAKTAVDNGADLVLELPYPFSASVAEHFAFAALSVFSALGNVDVLAFGSEEKSTEELSDIAMRLDSPAFSAAFAEKRKIYRNLSFPKLTDRVYYELYRMPLSLSSNEILGVSYIRALSRLKSRIQPMAFSMLPQVHATPVRESIIMEGKGASLAWGENAVLTSLRLKKERNRFTKAARAVSSLEELFQAAGTAADTDARLKRDLLHTLLSTSPSALKEDPAFTVLLAANQKGASILKKIRKNTQIPVVTKQARGVSTPKGREQFERYLRAELLYPAFLPERKKGCFLLEKSPYIVNTEEKD